MSALASTRENHEIVFEERLWKRKQQQRLRILMLHFIDNNDGPWAVDDNFQYHTEGGLQKCINLYEQMKIMKQMNIVVISE